MSDFVNVVATISKVGTFVCGGIALLMLANMAAKIGSYYEALKDKVEADELRKTYQGSGDCTDE